MKPGRANRAAWRTILWSLLGLAVLFAVSWVGHVLGSLVIAFYQAFLAAWVVFAAAVLYLCRDPDPVAPNDPRAIVSPAHGTVDAIDETVESDFVKGACQRISISVSLLDVQVQYAPVTATVAQCEHHFVSHKAGKRAVETLLVGMELAPPSSGRVSVRIAAGTWGRRILPWVREGDALQRSQRVAMTRVGSRVELFLPLHAKLTVRAGDKVVGGQSVVAKRDEADG